MNFSKRFYDVLRAKSQERGWQSSFANKAGISQSSLSKIISGETKAPELSTVSAIIDALGDELFSHPVSIQRMGANSPVEDGIGDCPIPVYAMAGAGPAIIPDESEILFNVYIPASYIHRADFAIMIDGHSMEPLIPHGSIVGIWKDAPFKANEIFLAYIPYEGLVVKRIAVDIKSNEFIFKSQNPDKDSYPDFRMNINDAEKIILGRMVWLLCGY